MISTQASFDPQKSLIYSCILVGVLIASFCFLERDWIRHLIIAGHYVLFLSLFSATIISFSVHIGNLLNLIFSDKFDIVESSGCEKAKSLIMLALTIGWLFVFRIMTGHEKSRPCVIHYIEEPDLWQIKEKSYLYDKYFVRKEVVVTTPDQVPYQVIAFLGAGASGKVYKVVQQSTGNIFAAKAQDIENDEDAKTVRSEMQLVERLKHPNILRILDVAMKDISIIFILDYLQAGSLESVYKRKGPFPEKQVAAIMKQLMSALAYLETEMVIHRDIRCENILAASDGTIKLADFGAGTCLKERSYDLNSIGHPFFMAPEMASRKPYNTLVDVWAAGLTMIEMSRGRLPFPPETSKLRAITMIKLHGVPKDFELPSHFSKEAHEFVEKCCRIDPSRRASALELSKHPFVIGPHGQEDLIELFA